ncbi:MAG: class IV adenylate cyclase [Planctomycetia bacterium]|nr:class IV adenylate cyclase [Planctomycetia bacterium]
MKLEIEQKFPVADPAEMGRRLTDLGAAWHPPIEQRDTYFAHPQRDFGQTDEALRIRRTPHGCFVTYKGPRLDGATKTRRELELPLVEDHALAADRGAAADAWAELLRALGFAPVADVRKTRTPGIVKWSGVQIETALDHVEGLGHFLELELVVESEGEPGSAILAAAQENVESLAATLGLTHSERRSYLELLLSQNA